MYVLFYRLKDTYRYVLVFLFILAYFVYLLYSLYKIQVRDNELYESKASSQYSGKTSEVRRGKIYFFNKNTKGDLAADTEEVEKLQSDKKIKSLSRVYPYKEIGAKVLGFVAYVEDDKVGRYGIEKYYNDILSHDDEKFWSNFFAEVFGQNKDISIEEEPVNKGDIVLTIDGDVQKFIHDLLYEVKKEWQSENIGGIVMNPVDGRIYAMEELETFDPNNFNKVNDPSLYKNNLVSGVYEMGSIIKPLTMAAAFDSGAVNIDSVYNDTGDRVLSGKHIRNYDGVARGEASMQQILSQSLNVGIVHLVEKMGTEKFREYFKSYGIGSETGIDLPSEVAGLTSNLDNSMLINSATAGFGQGIAITPIQTVRALAALGNGGKLVNPYIVDSIEYSNNEVKKIFPDEGGNVFKKNNTSEEISRMLTKVVDTALLKGKYKIDNYSVAAKTGTAQMAKPGGGYYEDKYLHSIFGYFPSYDPKYIVFLYHTDPKGADYASETLTEPLFKAIHFLISHGQVLPDR